MKHTSFLKSAYSLAALACLTVLSVSGSLRAQCVEIGYAQERTNAGQEFLLCFEDNDASNQFESEIYQEIYVASLGQAATVEITTLAESGFKETIVLAPNQSRTYRIEEIRGLVMNTSEFTDLRAIKVIASAPIVCYGLNHKRFSADAFMALPRHVAGREFRVMSFENSRRLQDFDRPSQFAFAAFEDNTTVTVIPRAETRAGKPAGQPLQFVLNAGQSVQIQAKPSESDLDMTGSIVRADKPITVYGGHSRSEIPSDSGTSSDHLTEALPPVHTWGKKFIVADYPFPGTKQPDLVRVLALNANTVLRVNGVIWATLGADQFIDTMYKGNLSIEASGPVLVGTYAHTTGDGQSNQLGDPFFIIAPPLEQTYTDFTFFNSNDQIYQQHFALIVTEKTGKTQIKLDDTQIPALAFRDLPAFTDGTSYAIARVGVNSGFHQIKTTNAMKEGVVVMAYGMGFIDSYGYTAAALFSPRNSLMAVNREHSSPVTPEVQNEIELRNITNETIFFDSVKIVLDGDAGKKYKVKLKENLVFNIRERGEDETVKLHFVVEPPLEEPITGVLRIMTHTTQWLGLDWSNTPFALKPQAQASVEMPELGPSVTLLHDPSGKKLSVQVALEHGPVTIKLYDALGRPITTVSDGIVVTGQQKFVIQKDQLASGYYFVEVLAGSSLPVRKGFNVSK